MFKRYLLPLLAFVASTNIVMAKIPTMEITVAAGVGGSVDVLGRDISRVLSKHGMPTVVVNRPGVGGRVGTQHVATQGNPNTALLMLPTGPGLYDPALTNDLNYNVLTDFEPIAVVVKLPVVLLVPATSKYQTIDDLIKDIRTPGVKLNWGHTSLTFKIQTVNLLDVLGSRADLVDVPFTGGAPVMQQLSGGHLDFAVLDFVGAAAYIESKTVRALAVTTKQRNPGIPDVPTFIEKKVQYESFAWIMLVARKGMPTETVNQISQILNKHLAAELNPSVRHATLVLGTPQEAKRFIEHQHETMIPTIRRLNSVK